MTKIAGATYQVARQSAKKCRGGRRSKSTVSVYATYHVARFPADSLPLSNRHVRSGQGVPPRIYILYLYCYSKRGQNQGIFPAFEDDLHFIKRGMPCAFSPLARRPAVANPQPC